MTKEEVFADSLIIFNKLRVSPAGVVLESDPKSGAGYDVRRGAGYSRVRPDSPTMGSAWPGMREIAVKKAFAGRMYGHIVRILCSSKYVIVR